jgi:hypothetical protein
MNQEPLPEKKRRLTILSSAAIIVGISAFAFSFIGLWAQSINWYLPPNMAQGPHPRIWPLGTFSIIIAFCGGLIGLALSITATIEGLFKKPRTIKILVSFLSFLLSFWAFLAPGMSHARMGYSKAKTYSDHLRSFRYPLQDFARKHNDQLPGADNWCDALLGVEPSPTYIFRIDNNLKDANMSNFAINANISGLKLAELPKNTVLLFETPLAKNPAGGPELMSTNNHPAKGCFVLFADMHIAFVRAEDFNNLRWKP